LSCRWNEESRPANIAQPIRTILRKHSNTQVLMDEVVGIDAQGRHVDDRPHVRSG
jgi:NADH dehydrogenase FAD-containing subunit